MEQPGQYRGRHYSEYLDTIESLKKTDDNEALEELLLALINVAEREAYAMRGMIAPYYYEQLAILYRKQKRDLDELKLLERYELLPDEQRRTQRLLDRLAKVRKRLSK